MQYLTFLFYCENGVGGVLFDRYTFFLIIVRPNIVSEKVQPLFWVDKMHEALQND